MRRTVLLTCTLAACGGVEQGASPSPDAVPDNPLPDAAVPMASCDRTMPFGVPVELSVNSSSNEWSAALSRDQLTIFFERDSQIYSAHRLSLDAPFSPPTLEAVLNGPFTLTDGPLTHPGSPWIDNEGLTLYWHSDRVAARGYDIYVATRAKASDPFGPPEELSVLNGATWDNDPYLTDDAIYFASDRTGRHEIYRAPRQSGSFGPPTVLAELASPTSNTYRPVLSSDQRTIYFGRDNQIWRADRPTVTDAFTHIEPVAELNTDGNDYPEWVSDDDCTLYFISDGRSGHGAGDIFVARRPQ